MKTLTDAKSHRVTVSGKVVSASEDSSTVQLEVLVDNNIEKVSLPVMLLEPMKAKLPINEWNKLHYYESCEPKQLSGHYMELHGMTSRTIRSSEGEVFFNLELSYRINFSHEEPTTRTSKKKVR